MRIRDLTLDARRYAEEKTGHVKQLGATANLRARFLREVPWVRAVDIARLCDVDTAEPARWKSERLIFSITNDDVEQFPLFQFANGQPIAAMRDILALFAGLSEWQIALWFFAPNAWLGNAPPMDVLLRDTDAVLAAAERAVEPIEG